MRRREFIMLLGGMAAWPLAARAQQQPKRMRRIGALLMLSEDNPLSRRRIMALEQGLEKLGWTPGANLQIDYRFDISDDERARSATAELLKLAPDVMVADSSPAVRAVQGAAGMIPVVFLAVSEPVAQGFVAGLAHPGGNTTGFANLEPSLAAKWLELLKQIAPHVARAAFMFNPDSTPTASLFFRSAETVVALESVSAPVRAPAEIDAVMTNLGREPGGGLILPPDTFTSFHHKLIVELAARHRLPAIYAFSYFTVAGGLVSYGPDVVDQFRRAAMYVDRILRGERAGDLPVQQPTKYELAINLKTAKALGLEIPPTLLARADEVIE